MGEGDGPLCGDQEEHGKQSKVAVQISVVASTLMRVDRDLSAKVLCPFSLQIVRCFDVKLCDFFIIFWILVPYQMYHH